MTIKILPVNDATLDEMEGQEVILKSGEAIVCIKLAFIKPETLEENGVSAVLEATPNVMLLGQMNQIRKQINEWFNATAKQYKRPGQ